MPAVEWEYRYRITCVIPASGATSSRLVVTNPERANVRVAASRIR
jgi:hypothetical protein